MTDEAALAQFILLPVSRQMISHLAQKASAVIRCEPSPSPSSLPYSPPSTTASNLPPSPPKTPDASPSSPKISAKPTAIHQSSLPTLEEFITSLVQRSHVQVPTLMSSLVYLARLKQKLPPVAKGVRCTAHRIFLASLILAAKYLNDSSPKNKHWAKYSIVRGRGQSAGPAGLEGPHDFGFNLTEVNLMEKQLLMLLDWDLGITLEDLYEHTHPFLSLIKEENKMKREQELAMYKPQEREEIEQERKAADTRRRLYSPSPPPLPAYSSIREDKEYSGSGRSSRSSSSSSSSSRSGSADSSSSASHYKSNSSRQYYYPTPPSSTQIPELIPHRSSREGSVASSAEGSPLLPEPPAHVQASLRTRYQYATGMMEREREKSGGLQKKQRMNGGILARFFQ